FVLAAALALAAPTPLHAQTADASPEDPAAQYDAAVRDAEIARPEEVRNTLTPVVRSNGGLVWERAGGRGRVLVATWVTDARAAAYAERLAGRARSMQLSDEVWVTLVPEGRRYPLGAGLAGDSLTRRLEQLLGLPPAAAGAAWRKVKFVEFWVSPSDLFRPCPDPEIADRECGIFFPVSRRVSRKHRDWFFEKLKSSYVGQVRFPWTRLGYTYDWAGPRERRDPGDHMGLSEFVVRPLARVTLNCVEETERYLREGCPVVNSYEQNKSRNRRRGIHRRRPRRPARP
ncbi:MAG TPA: hypothetical protein VEQ42_00805, partial [Pyrinomonadaceae bacterium]|nr:hypothetical protein [Pyrinomonadaceae bacterium]